MDDPGRLRGLHPVPERPRPNFFRTGREISTQIQQLVGRTNQLVHPGLFQSQVLQEELFLLVSIQLGNVCLDSGPDHQHLGPLVLHGLPNGIDVFVTGHHGSLVHVTNVQNRLVRQQHQFPRSLLLQIVQLYGTSRFSLHQGILVKMQHLDQTFRLGIPSRLRLLLFLGQTILHRFEVFQLQLCINRLLIPDRIDITVHVYDVIVIETTQHVNNGIRLPYIG